VYFEGVVRSNLVIIEAVKYVVQTFILFFFLPSFMFNFYLQKAEAFVCAAVPLWCRSNSTKSSVPTDNSTSDAKTGQGYVYGSSLLAY
jgi:hypothetical protein